MKIGMVHCLDGCPDAPFVVACGGDNPCENLRLFDIREASDGKNFETLSNPPQKI